MAQPLSTGSKAPDIINVVIEIRRGERNKYEIDKETGYLTLDRVNGTMLGYPCDYGYVPNTLCDDGDPLDVLLVIDESVPHGVVVPSRAVGVLRMVDDGEGDEKLICVAADDVTKSHIRDLSDLGPEYPNVISHFYAHYKDWKNNWSGTSVELNGFGDAAEAREVILASIALAQRTSTAEAEAGKTEPVEQAGSSPLTD